MMAARQRSQQEAFHKLTRASKDKVNDAMFTSIKTYDGKNRQAFEDGSMRSIKPAESADMI